MAAATDANANASSSSFNVKLIIDKKEEKVLCAEAGKEFVDFLFNFLAMPIGAIARLATDNKEDTNMGKTPMSGCIQNPYNSARNMNQSFFQSTDSKDYLVAKLHPQTKVTKLPLLPIPPVRPLRRSIYRSNSCTYHTNPSVGGTCHLTFTDIDHENCHEADFVKGIVTYLVLDDLTVFPLESMMSGLSLLSKFNIKDLGAIEERVVQVGMNEGLGLLWAFMHTKSALTTVFLEKNESIVKKRSS